MTIAEIFHELSYGPAPEEPAAAQAWLDRHDSRMKMYVGGAWRRASSGESFETTNPATGARLADVPQASREDVAAAVAAARAAFGPWSRLTGHARARYLYALARAIQKHSRLFAVLESLDNGKPIRESRDLDVPLAVRHFYYHAGWAQVRSRELPDLVPIGVVAQVIPWNFPLLMLAWKIAPALAAGNTVVLKPAEYTSLTALLFAELCDAIRLPPGVVNIVTGDGRAGQMLVEHPDIDKVAFTGSTEVGRLIRAAIAGSGKKLSLELGGKSPFIVFEGADLDSAVEGVVDAIWFNQGQVCCAGSRILVQESLSDALVAKLRARMETLRIGQPLDKGIDIGAIVAPIQLERIRRLVAQAESEGATLWQPPAGRTPEGCFFPPTLLTNVSPASTASQVEIFGPVVSLMTFRTRAEAVELANNTRYGLAASIWTENISLALDAAHDVKAGTIWINSTNVFDAASGFGGYRESGFGREGGREGMLEYLVPAWHASGKVSESESARGAAVPTTTPSPDETSAAPAIDRTSKLYIGGRQVRPDQGYSATIVDPSGNRGGEAAIGNRKDIRNAVEAARGAAAWGRTSAHERAQVLFYLAENLAVRRDEFVRRLETLTQCGGARAGLEVDLSIERLFTYAGLADKWEGTVHRTGGRRVTLAVPEPVGTVGIVCPRAAPLLAFVSTVAPAIAMGNTVIAVPSGPVPLPATDFYQVLDTSDVPAGVVNIVTGDPYALGAVLAAHDDVDGVWFFWDRGGADLERLAAGNMKRTWVEAGLRRDWFDAVQGEGAEFLRHATEVKNIWIPYGD